MSRGGGLVYCGSCGAQISEHARFCTSCGSRQDIDVAGATAPAPAPAPAESNGGDSSPLERSVPLWKRPERLIRDYVEQEGNEVTVPARHLRSSWELDDWNTEIQQTIDAALQTVGVSCRPSLVGTAPDDDVLLSVEGTAPSAEAAPEQEPAAAEELAATHVLEPSLDVLPPPTAPAGWYANPAGPERERWWDGERWTDRRR